MLWTEESGGTFVVAGSPWTLIAWTALTLAVVVGVVVTAAKGRWGWVLVGMITVGIIWPLTAFLPATEDSLWRRVFRRRAKPAR